MEMHAKIEAVLPHILVSQKLMYDKTSGELSGETTRNLDNF